MKDVQETHLSSKTVQIEASHEGQRLDNFLITSLKNVPKSHLSHDSERRGEDQWEAGETSLEIEPCRLGEAAAYANGNLECQNNNTVHSHPR